jgi:capsular exopolysaccharide synthesis family protein
MAMQGPDRKSAADWLQPPAEQEGLRRYVETLRERIVLILSVVALTTAVAAAYVVTATKEYEAQADVLVTPINSTNPTLASLGLIPASTDPTRDVETAAQLVANTDVAEAVKRELRSPESAAGLLAKTSAVPVAQSNIVAVTATESTPKGARDLANAFANGVVKLRTRQLHEQIDQRVPRLEAESAALGSNEAAATLQTQIAELRTLRNGPDPTIRVETEAPLPSSPSSPRPVLTVVAGILAGLILGIGAAFASQTLDPRLRRESQLRRMYRLPILGRVPKDPGSRRNDRPLSPTQLQLPTAEAYRTLRATLTTAAARQEGSRVILITGASASEGKTSTAVNLATSLALAGKRVIVIEADLRRPSIANTLGVTPHHGGVVSVLIENVTLEQALVQTPTYGPNLRALLADYEGGWISDLFSIPAASQLLTRARELADFVIVDAPPVYEVTDALPIAEQADDVLIVVRLRRTRLDKIQQLAELLADSDIQPAGFVVVGTPSPDRRGYYYHRKPPNNASPASQTPALPAHNGS